MKKLMTVLAAGLVAAMATADVTSGNVVGYVEKTIYPGFNMLAFNWDLVNNPEAGISVQDIFDTSKLTGGLGSSVADTINIHDASTGGFEILYLYDGTGTSYTENDGKWLESDRSVSTRSISVGSGFWYISRGTDAAGWEWAEAKPYNLD